MSSGNARFSARRFIVSSRSRLSIGTPRPGFTLFRSRRAWTRYMTLARNPTLTPTAASRISMPWTAPQNRSPLSHAGHVQRRVQSPRWTQQRSDSPTSPITTGSTNTAHACLAWWTVP